MADSGIPDKYLPAVRLAIFWIGLPFIGLLLGSEKISDGKYYEAAAWFVCAFVSILIAVYWDNLIPHRLQAKPKELEYLPHKDTELGSAVRDMVWHSAWARWYAAQCLVNSGRPVSERDVLSVASFNVMERIVDGELKVRGRLPARMDYEPIPQTYWRSSVLHFVDDPMTLWRMIIIPRGGAEISPDGTVKAHDATAAQRTAEIANYDSLIVDAVEFERLWPKYERVADKKRNQLLRKALNSGLDKDEILKLSGLRAKWQLQLLRFRLAGPCRH